MRPHAQLYPNGDQAETQIQGVFLPDALPSAVKCTWASREAGGPPSEFGFLPLPPPIMLVSRSQANARLRAGKGFFVFPSPLRISL